MRSGISKNEYRKQLSLPALRALQNPDFFTSELYRQAALAVATGVAIKVIVAIPVSLAMSLFDIELLAIAKSVTSISRSLL